MIDELRSAVPPDAAPAEERAWITVRDAWADREPVPPRRPRARRVSLVALCAVAAVGLLSPPGRAVVDRVREVVGVERAAPALFSLPAEGRLLVSSDAGIWVVRADGSKRLLGRYREASWSPYGRYVVAARVNELAALEPDGTVRWTLARRAVRFPRWGGTATDTRIAYTDRSGLRVVAGDGTGDRLVASGVHGPPAWRPGPGFVLAGASAGRVVVRAIDPERVLWRAALPDVARPTALVWSSDGSRLLVLTPHHLRVFDARGRLVAQDDPSEGWPDVAAAFVPGSRRIVVARVHGSQSSVYVLEEGRVLFNGLGVVSDLAPSPDGRWVIVAWRSADQWLFVRTSGPGRFRAVADVGAQFRSRSFPRLQGWTGPDGGGDG